METGRAESRRAPAAARLALGLAASTAIHGAIVLGALINWGSPQPFAATPPLAVDLVSPQDIPQPPKTELQLPQPFTQEQPRPEQPQPKPQPAKQEPAPEPAKPRQEQARPSPVKPDKADPTTADPGWIEGALQPPTPPPMSKVDLGSSPSEIRAKLPRETVAEFKAHLAKCWTAPAGIAADSAKLKVVVRIGLRPDGQIAAGPTLLQGPASAAGPLLLKSAMRALQQCQPYGFLPANKYKEWKILDLSFTPDGLLGG